MDREGRKVHLVFYHEETLNKHGNREGFTRVWYKGDEQNKKEWEGTFDDHFENPINVHEKLGVTLNG